MTIKQLKRVFTSELSHLYPQTEIDSFFYTLSEAYLSLKRVDIALKLNDEIKIPKVFHNALNELIEQKPLQYILGNTEFYGLPIKVNKHVLIPRPETEELVDWIITDVKNNKYTENLTILDVGTGSGCIAISLAKNIKNATIYALDISMNALNVAKENAIKNKVNIHFIEADIMKIKNNTMPNKIDVIVSNPPYVRNQEKKEIKNNVLQNEPHLTLFVSDENPLVFYEKITDFALKNLAKNGLLYFEINQYLANETIELLKNKGFKHVILKKDIFNKDRMIKAFF